MDLVDAEDVIKYNKLSIDIIELKRLIDTIIEFELENKKLKTRISELEDELKNRQEKQRQSDD